jgi:hypothetical protein
MGENEETKPAAPAAAAELEPAEPPKPEPLKAPAPVMTTPFDTTDADGKPRTVQYVELRSADGLGRVHNVLVEDWKRWGEPQSIEELNAGAKERAAAVAVPPFIPPPVEPEDG